MATASLLKASSFVHRDSRPPLPLPLQWRNPSLRTTTAQIPPPCIKKSTTSTGFINCSSSSRGPSAFSVQCVMNSKNCFMEEVEEEGDKERKRKRKQNLFEGFAEVMLKALQKPAVTAILLGVLLFAAACVPYSAIAASGGRMGGQSFSSHSSSSSSSSPSYSSSSGGGYSSSSGEGYSSSIGVGCSSNSTVIHLDWKSFLFLTGVVALFGIVGYLSDEHSSKGSVLTNNTLKKKTGYRLEPEGSVLKLQVGLMGKKRSLQKELDRIAETADTSTSKGLSYILQETTSVLLRYPDCCISCYSSVDVKQSIGDGEKLFNKLCIEERRKFEEETLVNVNNIKRQNTSTKGPSNEVSNEYLVITILVAAKGVHQLPAINGSSDLKKALLKLGSISSNNTMAALEVLWTPQKENDTLTEQELREDYPLLRPLYKDRDTQPSEK